MPITASHPRASEQTALLVGGRGVRTSVVRLPQVHDPVKQGFISFLIAAKTIDGDAHALQLDVTDQTSISAAAQRIRKEFGPLDVLINNAVISNTGLRPGMTIEEYSKKTRPERRVARRSAHRMG